LTAKSKLAKLIITLRTPSGLARRLHCGQQQRHEHANDRDDDQQFDKGESSWATHRYASSRQAALLFWLIRIGVADIA
jgi:hypothetical protein